MSKAQWPIGYGVGLRIKRSSVRIRQWPLRSVVGQGSLLPLSQGEPFTLASISYLAILVKYILAKKCQFQIKTHVPVNESEKRRFSESLKTTKLSDFSFCSTVAVMFLLRPLKHKKCVKQKLSPGRH